MGDWIAQRPVWKPSEIAKVLRCSEDTVRFWCREGTLDAFTTPGGHYRVTADALRAFVRPQAA
jgi:excisionase family DNA binding protein